MPRSGKMSGGYPGRDDEKNQEKRKHNKSDTIQHRNSSNIYEDRHSLLKDDEDATPNEAAEKAGANAD